MKINVTTLDKKTIALNVDPEMTVQDLLLILEIETEIPKTQFTLKFNKWILIDERKTLKFYAFKEGSEITMQKKLMMDLDFSGIQVPVPGKSSKQTANDRMMDKRELEEIRKDFLNDPQRMIFLKFNNPKLADAIISGDLAKMSSILKTAQEKFNQENDDYMKMALADPFDEEAQRLIEEEIKHENIERNHEHAMEFAPEMFGVVCMLYINCKVNGIELKAFVDSGAQSTMMSLKATKECNIHHMIDQRYRGIALGVGTQPILGKIHLVDMGIEGVFIPTSFSILEDQPMDILLGLDLLKRHQCCIDLKNSQLIIGTTGTATRFLTEADIPKTDEPLIPTDPFTEDDVMEIVMLGFKRPIAISTLRKFNGEKDLAIADLVSNKM